MKRSVELLSTVMRTIDLETIFVNYGYIQFGINFHSFKLTLSLDTEVLFDRQKTLSQNFRINDCFCQIPSQSVFEVLFKLL